MKYKNSRTHIVNKIIESLEISKKVTGIDGLSRASIQDLIKYLLETKNNCEKINNYKIKPLDYYDFLFNRINRILEWSNEITKFINERR